MTLSSRAETSQIATFGAECVEATEERARKILERRGNLNININNASSFPPLPESSRDSFSYSKIIGLDECAGTIGFVHSTCGECDSFIN